MPNLRTGGRVIGRRQIGQFFQSQVTGVRKAFTNSRNRDRLARVRLPESFDCQTNWEVTRWTVELVPGLLAIQRHARFARRAGKALVHRLPSAWAV
jgi:hypothetical protein